MQGPNIHAASPPRIIAIIVSFNRLEMVRRCVNALRAQTRKLDAILVVDASTTTQVRAWLDAQTDVNVLYVPDEGSGGSLHYGMKWAVARGFDWLWLFDDDVVVCPDALGKLLEGLKLRPTLQLINSLSLRENDATRPSIGAVTWRKRSDDYLFGEKLLTVQEMRARADAAGFLDTIGGQFFQGTLIARDLVERIGVPRIELFTRGDEVEYSLRLMRAGQRLYIYLPSIVTHPSDDTEFITLVGQRFPVVWLNAAKRYYAVRNSIVIRREYYARDSFLLYVVRRTLTSLAQAVFAGSRKSWRERWEACCVVVRGVRDGMNMDTRQLLEST